MKTNNLIYFVISSVTIFILIYTKLLYNIYLHPTEAINSKNDLEIILFGDFKYLFKIINCHNLGFDVYSSNECYKDYYGSFLYGPLILIFPSINDETAVLLTYFLSTIFILSFVFLTIKIIKPDNLFKYILTSLILFNPTTFFLYEKLNIDILIYILLIILVYYSKKIIVNFVIISSLTLTKFYPAIFVSIFLLDKKIIKKNIIFFMLFLVFFTVFIYLFLDNMLNVLATLDYVSQSLRYSFSINSLVKIVNFITNNDNQSIFKIVLILTNLITGILLYKFILSKKYSEINMDFNQNDKMFILSSSLSISLYLIFGNNFYREIYLIGTIPFLLSNFSFAFFKYIVFLFIIKYLFLMFFFPYYYNADLNTDILAQLMIGIKSIMDFILISALISCNILISKIYFKNFFVSLNKNAK